MFDQIPEKDKQMTAKLRETVLLGERAMLYTLGFQFYIHHPYYTVLEVVNKLAKSTTSEIAAFWDKMLKKHLQVRDHLWHLIHHRGYCEPGACCSSSCKVESLCVGLVLLQF